MIKKTENEIMEQWDGDITRPIVSICTTTYNHEKYISEALDSFLMQETNFSFEIIVRDDASTDSTAEIIRKYEQKYPNIIKPIYESENGYSKGVKPLPITINKAKGKYIAICEGDDYWIDTKKLQIQKDFLDDNKEYVISYTSVEAFDENRIIKSYIGGAKKDLTQDELQKATPINTLTTMFRNVIEIFPPEMSSSKYGDLFIWSILGYHGKGKYLPEIKPSRYRIHPKGVHSSASHIDQYDNTLISYVSLMAYHKRVGNQDIVNYYKKCIIFTIIKTNGFTFVVERIIKEMIKSILFFISTYFKSLMGKLI